MQRVQELVGRIHVDEMDVPLPRHDVDHAVSLAAAQQTVVDEHTRQLLADGAVHEGRRHRRVDAAAQRAEDAAGADRMTDVGDGALDE